MTNPATAQILQRISTLPPLPAAIGRLLRLVNDPNGDFQEIARTIALDQTLTVQLLRIANSAFYGFSHQIRTVQQATVVLGRHAVRNMALSLAMITLRNRMQTDWPLTPEAFWRHSMGVACGARLLARHVRGADPEEAFVAGLLHDIGKVILMEHDKRGYRRLLQEAERGAKPLHLLEHGAFGIDHAEVGRALCQHWNIPETLGAATAAHHGAPGGPLSGDARLLCSLVHLANVLSKLDAIGNGGNPMLAAHWRTDAPEVDLSTDGLQKVAAALPAEVARNEQIFFQTSPAPADNSGREGDPSYSVRIHLSDAEQRDLLALAVRALHFHATTEGGAGAPSAVVVDGSLPEAEREAYRQTGIPVLDFTQWRAQYAPSDWINAQLLQGWLTQHFSVPAAAV